MRHKIYLIIKPENKTTKLWSRKTFYIEFYSPH
jgi:hypothetical protein